MRRPAILLFMLASLSLALVPFSALHAHIGDHADVLVHGGHSHDLNPRGHSHDGHHDAHRDGHDNHDQPTSDYGDSAGYSANAHVVQLHPVALDHATHYPIKVIANLDAEPADPPPLVILLEAFPPHDSAFVIRRAHLRPLLRGPPR